MLTPREQVLLLGERLAIGATINSELCFWCNGGGQKDKSFSVTRKSSTCVAYDCKRAKCGKSGYVFFHGGGEETTRTEVFKPNPYPKNAHMLDLEDMSYLDGKYGLDLEMVYRAGWLRAEDNAHTFLLPVWSPLGALRGHVSRTEHEKGKEIRSWKIQDEPWLCWYRTPSSDVVVVEDQISALKAASFTTSVALLGATLSFDKLEEIRKVAGSGRIWLAYDKDATKKTFDALKRYRSFCEGNLFGLMLSKDLKNLDYEEIRNLSGPFGLADGAR